MSQKRNERSECIAALNDQFRKDPTRNGRLMLTAGVSAEGPHFVADVIASVRNFSDFTANNDPHGEHDFGAVLVQNVKLFWKIDYYDPTMEYGSEDPNDPTKTTRVMTIMLADEY